MRQVIRHIILLTTLLLLEVTSSAQGVSTFPVQVTTQVMSPSVYLTDYESGFEERVSVILLNRDVMSTGVDVRLRLTIKCQNGLTLRTKPSAVFEAISLYPGSPERLGMSDLSPYFDVRNLDVNGSLVQGTLPEGLATFTFEAVEYHTGVVVSTQGVAVTNLTMNKPPALLFPMDRSVINSRAARSVLFQWQPRHTYTQEGVTYEITLKEITDTLANPTSAYNYSQSIYQTETTGTSLIYSVSEPPLEAGKRYGWCVRAYRADGTGGSFTNGGYSEVFTFDVRETPLDNQTDVKDSISDTPVKKQEKDYSHCGEDNYRVTNLTPTDALEVGDTITVGGGFNVVLTTLRQSGYLYSGEGYMYIPYVGLTFAVDFNGIKVNTDKQLIEGYTEVRRDASKAQIGGTDAILQGGANRLKNGVLLPDVTVDFNMEDASGADYDSVSNTVTVYDEEGSKVGSFTVPQNETGESVFPVTVKDKAGNIVRIDEETDADGKPTGKYKFTPLGSQSAGQHVSEQTLSTLRSDLGSVDFEEDADGIYTFDQPLDYYETVSLMLNSDGANGGGRIYRKVSGYDVPWLFIAEGGTESVRANLTLTKSGKSEIRHPENITFIINDEGGVITLPSEYDAADNTYSVRVSASQADSRQTVYALYQSGDQSHTLGQLDVDTRAPLTAKVCLVNLGGKYDKSRIETNINAIYQRVGVTWSVEEENGFMYPKEKLERLFDKKSGALELYNENQKSLNKAFEAYMGERYDGGTCYVFMMPANGSGSKRDLAGFMPRGEQYGYINTDVILQEQMPAVIAHELGHGKFRLRHTFDSEYGKGAESKKGKTDNLMDYAPTPSSATHIAKRQWNQIHNPALLTELWEKDEDSEWVVQVVQCLTGAAIDVVINYGFKWAEFLMDGYPVEFTDYEKIFSEMNTAEVVTSAGMACATSVIPFPVDKSKANLIASFSAALGAGATAVAANLETQYNDIQRQYPDKSFNEVLSAVNWAEVLKNGGVQAVISGLATSVTIYATTHPKFIAFKDNLKKIGYVALHKRLVKAGLDDSAIDEFCKKFEIRTYSLEKTTVASIIREDGVPISKETVDIITKNAVSYKKTEGNTIICYTKKSTEAIVIENGNVFLQPKGLRPDPSEYLTKEYIDSHLEKFKDGVSCLKLESIKENFKNLGMEDGLFVLPKYVMDEMIERAGNNISKIERELGIPAGDWNGKIYDLDHPLSLIRIDILPSQIKKLRIPTGNEFGANNKWVPGGYTDYGLPEAVIEPIPWEQIENSQITTIIKP